VAQRRDVERQLRESVKVMQSKSSEMEQFAYIVSHDLKSPLVSILGFVGLLREDLGAPPSPEVRDSLERVERAALRMSDLIDDVLALSRVGLVKHDSEPVDLAALVQELREELGGRLEEVGAALVLSDELHPIHADRLRARQALQNLLTNALKYGCRGSAPTIWIGTQVRPPDTLVFVRDNGPGIRREYHEKIFRLFEQAEPGKQGTGVGLALVTKIMEAHGGRAWVESTPGEGATFWLAFPNAPAAGGNGRDLA
jgi:signal transduction histidine kinase